jgi:hypothetical protein
MCKARVPLRMVEAAKRGDGPSVARLLQTGGTAKVDAKDEGGMTALMLGALGGHLSVVRALIGAGANVEAEDSNGDTALLLAEANSHSEVVEELERAEGELHAKRDAKRVAEMEALAKQQAELQAQVEAKRLAEIETRAQREAKREALQAAKMEKERQEKARLEQVEELVQSHVSGYDESNAVLPRADFETMVRAVVESGNVAGGGRCRRQQWRSRGQVLCRAQGHHHWRVQGRRQGPSLPPARRRGRNLCQAA